jgi:hypothetical protein
MPTLARSAPLLALALLPAAAGVEGCFSSTNAGPTPDAGTEAEAPTLDASLDGPGDATSGPPTDQSAADQGVDQGAPPPPAAGGTGAFGIITINGKQKMYLPQPNSTLANGNASITVVDVGAPGNGFNGAPAQIANIDLGSTNYATATGGDATAVIAVSTAYNTIYFIDPATDTLTKTIQLDSTFGVAGFSGVSAGYVTGVAVDSAHNRAILSVWNGFAIVDLTTQSITNVIQAPPSENFGFDSVRQWIIAPFYDCTSAVLTEADGAMTAPSACTTPTLPEGGVMTDGLSIIDLTDNNAVYTYQAPTTPGGAQAIEFDPTQPVGTEPDSAAIDPTTGVAVVTSEGSGWENVIDLSKATFDKTTMTVTAPQNIVAIDYEGVAVEPTHHLAFWEAEGAQGVAIADLTLANMGGTGAVQGTMPTPPGGAGFTNLDDPHGIAVTTALTTSGPVGFVVDSSYQWVARIDLQGMLEAGGADGSATLDDLMMAPFVTYLDALTPENPVPDAGADDAGSE